MTTKNVNGRDRVSQYLCGWCSNAARSTRPVANHRRCVGPCACGALGHKFTAQLATIMARTSRLDVDAVYERHGRKRRTLNPEQRAAAIERLVRARAAR